MVRWIRLPLKEILCQNTSRNRQNQGYATVWYMLAIVLILSVSSLVVSQGFKNIQQYKIKTTMNRAVKAATMQYDIEILSKEAKILIDEDKAEKEFKAYVTDNLKLDNNLNPKERSVFENSFDIVHFQVIDEKTFPYTVELEDVNFHHTFENPGVLAVIKTKVEDLWGTDETTYYVPAVAEVNMNLSEGT